MAFFNMSWVLTLLLLITIHPVLMRVQLLDCSFQQVDLLPCLSSTSSENTTVACCLALNQALKAGHNCLCSLLSSTNLRLDAANSLLAVSPLAFMLPGCALISASLASCGAPLELNPPPVESKDPILPMVAAAPVPGKMESAMNSTHADSEVPRATKSLDPMFIGNTDRGGYGVRLEICKSFASLVWLTYIFSWIV